MGLDMRSESLPTPAMNVAEELDKVYCFTDDAAARDSVVRRQATVHVAVGGPALACVTLTRVGTPTFMDRCLASSSEGSRYGVRRRKRPPLRRAFPERMHVNP